MSKRARRRAVAPSARAARRAWLSWASGGALLAAVVAIVAAIAGGGAGSAAGGGDAAGLAGSSAHAPAPDGKFTTTTGAVRTVSSLHGRPTLLWFVTTWCSSCQAGTQAMSAQIPALAARHVQVVELELAGDLGQGGPSISAFASQLAGSRSHHPDWTFGTASAALTRAYDPGGYLDIYYLLSSRGEITYVNSSPAATMRQLLHAVDKITRDA